VDDVHFFFTSNHTRAILLNDAPSRDHDHDQMRRGGVHFILVVVVVVL
jgi:hypothetical protein